MRRSDRLAGATLAEIDYAIHVFGNLDEAANHFDCRPKTLQNRRSVLRSIERAGLQTVAVQVPEPAVQAETFVEPAVAAAPVDALAAVLELLQQQAEVTRALVAAMTVPATPVATPVVSMPTAAPAAAVPTPANDRAANDDRAGRRDDDFHGPLGDGRPYAGSIFGTTRRRNPLVAARPSTELRTTLVVGDSHFHPAITPLTARAMTLVGLHGAALRPEHVVHIGDGGDWSSVCQHVRNDTWKAREKPSIRQDLDCFRENWSLLNAPLDDAGVAVGRRHYCWGNHDAWLHNFEDAHPELRGLATGELTEILRGARWSQSDYGEYYFIGGVGYTHVPLNMMGRPVGGQTGENTIANQSTRDTVFGHTHRYAMSRRPKMDGTMLTVLNAGNSMPEFYVGEYAQLCQGRSLDYGCLEVVDFDGRIQSHRFVPMRELEARYGADADRRLRHLEFADA